MSIFDHSRVIILILPSEGGTLLTYIRTYKIKDQHLSFRGTSEVSSDCFLFIFLSALDDFRFTSLILPLHHICFSYCFLFICLTLKTMTPKAQVLSLCPNRMVESNWILCSNKYQVVTKKIHKHNITEIYNNIVFNLILIREVSLMCQRNFY